ncbi:MAG: acylphosphatase [Acidobacteriia bacterium]|nr:acylphosphatase [Terriglobia bacterium]
MVSTSRQPRRYFISGIVQGVGYRYYAQRAAQKLELAGYVRNLEDGRVEAYAVGAPEQLAAFSAALKKGPLGSQVTTVIEEHASPEMRYDKTFSILTNS